MRFIILASVLCLIGFGVLTRTSPQPEPAEPDLEGWTADVTFTPTDGASPQPPAHPAGGGLPGGAFVDESMRTYPVRGETEREILASLRANGPSTNGQSFFGLTASESSYHLQPRMQRATCVAEDARVELAVTITLPSWDAPDDAPYKLKRDWARFETALKRHEDGHRDIAVQGAEAIRDALRGFRRASCREVQFEARQRADRIALETEEAHNRYDEQTDHGRTQGAQWPLP